MMILVNTDYISGKNLEMLGLVKGSTIQSKFDRLILINRESACFYFSLFRNCFRGLF
jgi:hypothetical protein